MQIQTFVLSYDEVPKSLNRGGTGSRRHWSAGHREKMRWEGLWGLLLMERGVPRGMAHCRVRVLLEFRHRNRRDAENYRPSVLKPFADVMVKMGYLADDTSEFFEALDVRIDSGVDLGPPLVKGRTTISLECEYA